MRRRVSRRWWLGLGECRERDMRANRLEQLRQIIRAAVVKAPPGGEDNAVIEYPYWYFSAEEVRRVLRAYEQEHAEQIRRITSGYRKGDLMFHKIDWRR